MIFKEPQIYKAARCSWCFFQKVNRNIRVNNIYRLLIALSDF